ncbi:MAG TPA: cupin domain-containing protein [Paraburkholderia sp.]
MNSTLFAESVNLQTVFDTVTDYWSPKVVAQVNNQHVKVAKLRGEFVWHSHQDEDELFYVVRGNLRIEYEDGHAVHLSEGSIHVVPRGVRHHPVADEECWIVLVEPVSTKHTGEVQSPLTKTLAQQLG